MHNIMSTSKFSKIITEIVEEKDRGYGGGVGEDEVEECRCVGVVV